ncbi:DUF6227 family protein [Streptomyces sp. NPDC007088]|uniref:DUF6227 family protein n=1 Tax=Streptomyces sp. NPDC007088 TaxID=3364773 RepID=UPI0036CD1546
MSVPYETPEPPEGPVARLLGRALNSFELPDDTLSLLNTTLAYDSSLHSAHHSASTHHETYRHCWLLPDGGALTLWELVHRTVPESETQHEIYATAEEAAGAAARWSYGPVEWETVTASDDLGLVVHVAEEDFGPQRDYAPDDSADHARRLLRRAENTDRPREDIAVLLHSAFAHEITQAFTRPGLREASGIGFALYEHAFLLLDGTELSLWEVEHTATPDRRHMCEVYETETEAHEAMERRARVL